MEKSIRKTGRKNFLVDGFPRSLANLEGWYEIFGQEVELPKMLYFVCRYAVLEKRILGRAKWSRRSDDNVESVRLRFDPFEAETLPTVELFKSKNKCVEIGTSRDRQSVYALVGSNLAEYTDKERAAQPLTEKAEIILGLRTYPKEEQKLALRSDCPVTDVPIASRHPLSKRGQTPKINFTLWFIRDPCLTATLMLAARAFIYLSFISGYSSILISF